MLSKFVEGKKEEAPVELDRHAESTKNTVHH
jgi:hypothetical protein